jgi:DNA invertase Pin-like site-specific DNA recombinase
MLTRLLRRKHIVIIGYMRVSTDEQNLDLQRDALTKAGAERIFEDKASGSKMDRPGLAEALRALRQGDVFMVWKLDRLGRSMRGLVELIEELAERGIDFCGLTEGIDTTTPAGRFFFHILAALAQMERDLIRERTRAGLTAARARGRNGGRPRALKPKQICQARRLLEDRSNTVTEVAETLGVSRATLYRALEASAAA